MPANKQPVALSAKNSLICSIECDDDGSYIADCPALNIYAFGDTRSEAIDSLKQSIASLYEELNDGSSYSSDWEDIRSYLNSIVERH